MRTGVAALLAGVIGISSACSAPPSPPSRAPSGESSRPVLSFTGVTFNETCDAATSVLSVDALEVRDRKLGLFSMRGIEDVEMRGVRARLASCPHREASADGAAPEGESPRFDELLALPIRDLSLGFVSRISAQPAELVFQEGGEDLLRVEAGRIDLALGSGGLRLANGVVIRARDGSELHASRAEWRVREGTLRVSGPHEFADAAGTRQVAGDGRFALDRSGTLRSQP